MGKLESITTLASLAVGAFIFIKAFPLIQGLSASLGSLGGGGGIGGILPSFEPPTATPEDFGGASVPPAVKKKLIAESQVGVSKVIAMVTPPGQPATARDLFKAGNILAGLAAGTPSLVTPSQIPFIVPGAGPVAFKPPTQELLAALISSNAQFVISAQQPPQFSQPSGSFWINPITGQTIAPFVPGQTPAEVKRLRNQDIFASIRSL